MSVLLLDPITTGPVTLLKKFIYNKKVADGKVDEITDQEKLLFESKANPKLGIFSGYLNPEKMISTVLLERKKRFRHGRRKVRRKKMQPTNLDANSTILISAEVRYLRGGSLIPRKSRMRKSTPN